jgi:hypothetical protein
MPLTRVIDYFNAHLEAFSPQASLRRHARFLHENGQVSAELAGKHVRPRQQPILELAALTPVAHESRIQLAERHSVQETTDPLYFYSWDREDVIFLARFLRGLHALHHLSFHGIDAPRWWSVFTGAISRRWMTPTGPSSRRSWPNWVCIPGRSCCA